MPPIERSQSPERRFLGGNLQVTRRAKGENANAPCICGRAIVYNTWTTLYESKFFRWREIIRPGAATNALKEKQDVRCLFNHDPNFILGRTASGTLNLTEDDSGLSIECDAPDTQTIRDMVMAPMERGDLTGQSFSFTIRAEGQKCTTYEEDGRYLEDREVTDIDLYDVGPVTYPQYPETDVGIRSAAQAKERQFLHRHGLGLMKMRQRRSRIFFPA